MLRGHLNERRDFHGQKLIATPQVAPHEREQSRRRLMRPRAPTRKRLARCRCPCRPYVRSPRHRTAPPHTLRYYRSRCFPSRGLGCRGLGCRHAKKLLATGYYLRRIALTRCYLLLTEATYSPPGARRQRLQAEGECQRLDLSLDWWRWRLAWAGGVRAATQPGALPA